MTATEHVDVVVVGAGLSGIGAAYRLSTECPDRTFAVLEARDTMGGTWDLFRYPGVRSDSDMFTLGYEFHPWRDPQSIADGPSILSYIRDTAATFDLEKHVRYRTRVVAADWSTEEQRWTVELETNDGPRTMTCSFLYACSGYYDYDTGHTPVVPGLDDFAGQVVHPQFWPEDLDYDGKRVVVIGSGATAVTLVPSMAERAAHVTMLQRTPTWIGRVPGRDKIADTLREKLPAKTAHKLIRTKNIAFTLGFFTFCQKFPDQARKLLNAATAKELGGPALVDEHFSPDYKPWDQRFCAAPDGDFFKAIRRGDAEVVTDQIEQVVPEGIRLRSGRLLEADVVVTATGLKLQLFGGVRPSVDGQEVPLHDQFVWQGSMLTGLPNLALCVGYTNASWTLRADLTHRLVCKVLNHLGEHGYAAVVPRPDPTLRERPLLDLSSGYITRALPDLPRQGDKGVWRVRQNYPLDSLLTLRRDLEKSLEFTPARQAVASVAM
ncbi:MAG: NAD(P)/FAD-dependent oxidoreductase [Marmoricola sp.]|nr:NAD(P)/FAD-dependent oxidoreductase [Marmoricola sp.]